MQNLSVGKSDYPVHFLCHFKITDTTELLLCRHSVETCPHVFKPQSAVITIIDIRLDSSLLLYLLRQREFRDVVLHSFRTHQTQL